MIENESSVNILTKVAKVLAEVSVKTACVNTRTKAEGSPIIPKDFFNGQFDFWANINI